MNQHPFTVKHYCYILKVAIENGYNFAGFFGKQSRKQIILRHDIDNDIVMAHRMAELEEEAKVKATYLVMIRSANYNAFEGRNVRLLREIAAMGHDIGLHFSLIDHPDRKSRHFELPKLIISDAVVLEGLLGLPVRVFGFHNPTDRVHYQISVPGLINTYEPRFFDTIPYLSESNMHWQSGCPCQLFVDSTIEKAQLLVHPLSYGADLRSDRDVLLHFLHVRFRDLFDYNVKQNRVLRKKMLSMGETVRLILNGDEE